MAVLQPIHVRARTQPQPQTTFTSAIQFLFREAFPAADVGPRPTPSHSLDRIDVNGDYKPSNCRWATRREQGNNTRRSRLITHDGRTQSLSQWAREVGMSVVTLFARLKAGWTVEDALTRKKRPGPAGRTGMRAR